MPRTKLLRSAHVSFYNIFDEHIVPSSRQWGVSQLLLAQTSMSKVPMPGLMRLLQMQRRRGRREHGSAMSLARWPEAKQVALRFPYLCFVLNGEADISVGDAIISCPAGHGILIPPGIPLTDGTTAHWERPASEKVHSDILWILLRPFGAECHLCHTRGSKHSGGGFGERALVSNRQLFQLGELLINEMSQRLPGYEEVASAYWQALVRLLLRHWEKGEALPHQMPTDSDSEFGKLSSEPESVVQRAKRYIEEHLGQSLSLEEIARAAFVSRAQLAKVFQQKTQTTVWQYVTERRFEEARSLLLSTDISVYNIARLVGFPHASHFCIRFTQLNGCSPNEFRLQHQTSSSEKKI